MNSIRIRESTRNFQETPLTPEDLAKIETYLGEPKNLTGPYGDQFELELILQTGYIKKETIGTYGFIKNPQGFIVGKSINDVITLFQFGYVFENLILYLSSLGIGNCWLGGTFNKEKLMSSLSLSENEIIPAITPLGYSQDTRHFKERVQRRVIGANQRKSRESLFFYDNFDQPLTDQQAGIYQQALHYVRIAPSAKNKQPWRIIFSKDLSKAHFYISFGLKDDRSYACPPEYLDIGIAYNHFEAGIQENGLSGKLVIVEPKISNPAGFEYITTWCRA